jgi:RNA polymerase sigma-70 factor (ECF subfamily)
VAVAKVIDIRTRGRAETAEDDDVLMRRYGDGDLSAFETLYRRHRGPLHRFLLRLSGNVAEAEEVFQDAWLAVIRSAERYEPTGRFAAYLFAIAHRRAIDHGRRGGRRRALDTAAAELEAVRVEPDPEQLAAAGDLGRALLTAVERLPLEQREAFLMQAEGGLTLEEIAEATSVQRETVKSRLRYANRSLRAVLEASR